MPSNRQMGIKRVSGISRAQKSQRGTPAPEEGMEKADQAERRSCLAER